MAIAAQSRSPAPLSERQRLLGPLRRLGFFAAVVASVALPFALVHCDPLIDGHGYMGDETMIMSLALNGAIDGTQSYGTEPDGRPLVWPGWNSFITPTYGPALLRTDPLYRVEMGRLVSRVLCILGALAWTLSVCHVIHRPGDRYSSVRGLFLGLLVSLTLVSFPPLAFVASFARNDALGFLFVCLTFSAAVFFIRRNTSPVTTASLVFVAGASFWAHFFSALVSCYLAGVALVLAAARARRSSRLGQFWRSVAPGVVAGVGAWCLLFLWLNGGSYFSDSTGDARADLLAKLFGRLAVNAPNLRSTLGEGVRLWSTWKEVSLVVVAVAGWAIVRAIRGRRRPAVNSGVGFLPGPFAVVVLQLPLLTAAVGSLSKTYPLHDVYRPMVLVALLSIVLLSFEIQPWNGVDRQRACVAIMIVVLLGVVALSRWDATSFSHLPGTEWSGFRPFDHSPRDDGWSATASREPSRGDNQERREHLEQLSGYLRREHVAALITFEPMLVLLRGKGLVLYYFHFQVPPVVRAPAHEVDMRIVLGTILGRGVRLVAATRNGFDERTFSAGSQPLRGMSRCIRRNWRQPSPFQCEVGSAVLSMELAYTTRGGEYCYGNEDATPIRLYRITAVQFGGSSVR
jgi:hypothetical protein